MSCFARFSQEKYKDECAERSYNEVPNRKKGEKKGKKRKKKMNEWGTKNRKWKLNIIIKASFVWLVGVLGKRKKRRKEKESNSKDRPLLTETNQIVMRVSWRPLYENGVCFELLQTKISSKPVLIISIH